LNVVVLTSAVLSLTYFALLNLFYLVFTAIAWRSIPRYLRATSYAGTDEALASPFTPGISILLPAYNEEAGIVESVRSLLALRYPLHEVVVVNDGSTDDTLDRLRDAFELVPAHRELRSSIASATVRGSYVSSIHPDLWVIDKENGGKADALNAGANAARHPYLCAVDADALIEENALLDLTRPILDDPDLVAATGGIVRIANDSTVDHGRVVDVRLPRSRIATIQVVEYFRAFLVGRTGLSSLHSLLIISGAFGLFRRDLVEEVGGWWTSTVGEDIELVLRLHTHLRERGEPYVISFVPDPVCWTEAPDDLRVLSRQRRRWHRGLAESLWRHRRAIGNPRYGAIGLFALPYFVVFELAAPIVELAGPPMTIVWWSLGRLSGAFMLAYAAVALLLGILLSVTAVTLEEFSFRRYPRGREVVRMLWWSIWENLGYRQLTAAWRILGLWDAVRRRRGWGAQRRRGFATA
jgi:cellulose synthase/poly-beta-1,6-N-acetylglucosamine synthase-like glycosyltransferase